MTGPLGQIVGYIHDPQAVKNVAGRFECNWNLGNMAKVKKGGKCQPHAASFVGDQRSATSAADFARQDSFMLAALTVEESQVIDPSRHSNIPFEKDGRPLHRCTVQFLAGQAMAEFGIHGIRTHVVLNRAAIATGLVFGYECRI